MQALLIHRAGLHLAARCFPGRQAAVQHCHPAAAAAAAAASTQWRLVEAEAVLDLDCSSGVAAGPGPSVLLLLRGCCARSSKTLHLRWPNTRQVHQTRAAEKIPELS